MKHEKVGFATTKNRAFVSKNNTSHVMKKHDPTFKHKETAKSSMQVVRDNIPYNG